MVEVEQRGLELGAHAVRRLDARGGLHQRVGALGRVLRSPGRAQHVAVPDRVLRQRQARHDASQEGGRTAVVAARGRDPGEPGLGVHMARPRGERRRVRAASAVEVARRRSAMFPSWTRANARCSGSESSRVSASRRAAGGGPRPSEQLAGVGDPGVRADARRELGHPVVGGERPR